MVPATILALTIVLLIIAIALRLLPPSRVLAGLGDREPHIDGLRGICALLVAAHHAVFVLGIADSGAWRIAPADHVLQTMGKSAVAYFFMICAYLFWGRQARLARERVPSDFAAFFRNRLARLLPAYLFAMIVIMIVLGFGLRGFRLSQGYGQTLVQVLRSLTFSFFGTPRFNDSYVAYVAIYVSWSLYYEWLFYFALPLIKVVKLHRVWMAVLPALLLLNVSWWHLPWAEYFLYGAIASELARRRGLVAIFSSPIADFASVALLVATNILATEETLKTGLAPAMLALSFVPIAAGASWGGLLRLDALRFTGAVSYSLYLLNTPVCLLTAFVIYPSSHGILPVAATESVYILGAVLVGALSYTTVERPFLRGNFGARETRTRPESFSLMGRARKCDAAGPDHAATVAAPTSLRASSALIGCPKA